MGRDGLAGAAHLELVSGVVPLRPEDAMTEAMLRGWRAQQAARGLTERTITRRERLGGGLPGGTQRFSRDRDPGSCVRMVAVADGREASCPVHDPQLSGGASPVQRVPRRWPLWLGGGLRGNLRHSSPAHLATV